MAKHELNPSAVEMVLMDLEIDNDRDFEGAYEEILEKLELGEKNFYAANDRLHIISDNIILDVLVDYLKNTNDYDFEFGSIPSEYFIKNIDVISGATIRCLQDNGHFEDLGFIMAEFVQQHMDLESFITNYVLEYEHAYGNFFDKYSGRDTMFDPFTDEYFHIFRM